MLYAIRKALTFWLKLFCFFMIKKEILYNVSNFFSFLFIIFFINSCPAYGRSLILDMYGRKGSIDYDIFVGLSLSNLTNQPMPLYAPNQSDFLSYSLDTMLGIGYFLTNEFSMGIESGFSLNTINPFGAYKNPSYSISDLQNMGSFWGWLTPNWLSSNSIPFDSLASSQLLNMEIPLLIYYKFSFVGKFFQKVAIRKVSFSSYFRILTLQLFTGFNFSITKINTSFYQPFENSLFEISDTSHSYFLTEFLVGARLSLAFLSLQYFYHLGLNSNYSHYSYYQNRSHRISIGLILNGFFL